MDKKQYDVETLKLLKQYQKFKELLTVNIQYDIILKDNRIVLPTVFHRTAVKNKSFDEKQSFLYRHG